MAGVSHARLRRLAAGAAAGTVVGFAVAVLAYLEPTFLARAESATYDVRASSVASSEPSADIVFIDVSEEDIVNAERNWGVTWPWPRAVWGYIAKYAADGGAKVVAFDWIFQDRGQYSVDDAEEFAGVMGEVGNVVIGLALSPTPVRENKTRGSWGFRLRVVPSRADAEAIARRLMAWDVTSYLVGDGPTEIYLGGLLGADATSAMWDRISAVGELADAIGIADPNEPPMVEPAELPKSVLSAHYSIGSIIAGRDGHDLNRFSAPMPLFEGMHEPLAVIAAAPKHMGVVSQTRDDDGVMRRHTPFSRYRDKAYPSLSVAAYLAGNPDIDIRASGRELTIGDRRLHLDDAGRFIIGFDNRGRYHHELAYSVLRSSVQIEEGSAPEVDPAVFKDKYVIVSAVGMSLRDDHSSPVSNNHPGAEINANSLENLIAGRSVRRSGHIADALVVLACSFFSAMIVMLVWGSMRRVELALLATFAVAVGFGLAYWQFSVWLLDSRSLWIAAVAPLVGIGASAFAAVLTASAGERRSKRFVQEALGRYTSPALVAELTEHPEHLSLEWGEVRQMSVYFSDIAGFTSISEGLEPRKLVALLNEYLTSMTDIILAHDGVVDKYIGDAIMAFWGAPIPDDAHAVKAVRCALAMRKKCDELRPEWMERYGEDVFARAGVNSGEAVVGNMGSAHKYNYTVMGDMVNLAARLEGANKPYGSALMISEYTLGMLGDEIAVRELDLLAVKGKEEPVRVFEVLDVAGEVDDKTALLVGRFADGLELYRARDFEAALSAFERALEVDEKDGPSLLYAERCRHFAAEPPAQGWDGVWRMKTK